MHAPIRSPYGAFVGVARNWPYQLVQSPEVSLSRWRGCLQSPCGNSVRRPASLFHTQVRNLFRPSMSLAEAQELAGWEGAARLVDAMIGNLIMDLAIDPCRVLDEILDS